MFYNSSDIYLQRYSALPRRHCAGLVGISQLLVPLGELDQQQKNISNLPYVKGAGAHTDWCIGELFR